MVKVIKSIHFKMRDKRWRWKKYPFWSKIKNAIYGNCGCGPASGAIIDSSVHPDVLPTDIGTELANVKNGVTPGGATYWKPLLRRLEKRGWKVIDCRTMTQFLAKMNEAKEKGENPYGLVDLWGRKGGKTWTGGGPDTGHYVAVTEIKGQDMYIKDPGPRQTNGWANYKKHMQGHVKLCAVFIHPRLKEPLDKSKDKKKYEGTLPVLPTLLERLAVACAYPYKTAKSVYKYHGGKAKEAYKKALNKAYPERLKKGSSWGRQTRVGGSCDVFVGTCVVVSGVFAHIAKKFPRGLDGQIPFLRKHAKKLRVAKPKSGDIVHRNNHIAIWLSLNGEDYVANAHFKQDGGTYGIIEKSSNFNKYYRPPYKPTYLMKGDIFTSVKYLQQFLNWYGNYGLVVDCSFGPKTESAVRAYQRAKKLKITGVVDVATLKAIRKDAA